MFGMKSDNRVRQIPIGRIFRSAYQPRRVFDDEEIKQLSKSIEENGILQPIIVRKVDRDYEIVAGERRIRAAILADFETVPCIIINCDDSKAAVLSLLENIQRQNLDPFEEAIAIKNILDKEDITQEDIAKRLGKSQGAISNKLRLLSLEPNEIRKIRGAGLTERHARAFIRVKDKEIREKIIDTVIERSLNVVQTEDLINKQLEPKKKVKNKILIKDIRIFMNTISKAVKVMKSSGIKAESTKNETEEYIECIIKIPKNNNIA
ncbi:MAG: ParB/RepB/Spo0J family partition protein [Clostridia bacterium]|nr:ParB/RepB/Spo0J family partition protein [Clostridia bacterium]